MYDSAWDMGDLKGRMAGSHKKAELSRSFWASGFCIAKVAHLKSDMTRTREGVRYCVGGQVIDSLRSFSIKKFLVFNEEPFMNRNSAPCQPFQVKKTVHTFSKLMHLLEQYICQFYDPTIHFWVCTQQKWVIPSKRWLRMFTKALFIVVPNFK